MQAPAPGEVIADKYRIERVLGQGGMGVVLAATHLHLGNEVAIKCLLPEAAQQPEALGRFVQEARTCARLRSDHIVRVYDVGTQASGAPFLVMELLDGNDLSEHLRDRGPLPIDEVVGHIRDVCEGLAVAHAAGIVHRDLKPSNLFVVPRPSGARGTVKILDFGISKLLDVSVAPDALGRTASGGLLGSPYYMSPEQILDSRSVTGQADIWSLGVVMIELCTGVRPFVADSAPALLGKILSDTPVPLRDLRPDAPAWLEAVITRCLQKDPAKRPLSAAQLARELTLGDSPFGSTVVGTPTSGPGSGGGGFRAPSDPSGRMEGAYSSVPPARASGGGVVVPAARGSGGVAVPPARGSGEVATSGSGGYPRVEASLPSSETTQPEVGLLQGDRSMAALEVAGRPRDAHGRRRAIGLVAAVAAVGLGAAMWQMRPRTVLVRGSTTLGEPLQKRWRRMLEAEGLRLDVSSSGTTRGLEALLADGRGLAAASRRATDDEMRRAGGRLREYAVGYDALAIVTHVDNPVPHLSVQQLRGLFTGETRDWSRVGGSPGPVHLVMRPEELGGHEALRALLGDVTFVEGAEVLRSNEEVIQRLTADRSALSFASFTVAGPLRQVPVGRSDEGPFLAPSTSTVRHGAYPLVRPLAFYALGTLTGPEERFLEFMRGPSGQDALLAAGFVPLR